MDDLLTEAWKLRFRDPEREARFDETRMTSAKWRVRVTLAVGLVIMAVTGLVNFRETLAAPDAQFQAWVIRYLMCIPLWVVCFLSTWSRQFTRRMDTWLAPAIPVTCGLFTWETILHAQLNGVGGAQVLLGVNIVPLLMVSALAIPFRFRRLMASVGLSIMLPVVLVAVWHPGVSMDALVFGCLNLSGFGIGILIAGWWREAVERRLFAQRELMERANNELVRLNAEKNAFLALAAHDLRSPLASTRALADILLSTPEPPAAERREAVGEIAGTTDRMLELVTNFLEVHAIESGDLQLHTTRLDLAAAADACVRRHSASARRKGQEVALDAPSMPVPVLADPSVLSQILDNLVTNALKFSPTAARILVRVSSSAGTHVRCEVHDGGPGFGQEDFDRMFQSYTRLSARPTGGEGSLGLGLSLCKRFAEAMGGSIEVRNRDSSGAVVAVTLPAG